MDSPATNQSVEDKAPAIDPSERHPLEEDKAPVMDLSGKGKALVVDPSDLGEYIDELKAIDDSREEDKKFWIEMNRQIREEREGILNQYYTKGYAEYEVDDDDDEDEGNKGHARVAAPSGRRRFRHGVALKKNQSGGGSIRKI
uniref:Uncharacterized protein n=1 Tax=Oryza glumipatula TaxID=40148 RepID=A0A0D9Z2D5_9ORYZ